MRGIPWLNSITKHFILCIHILFYFILFCVTPVNKTYLLSPLHRKWIASAALTTWWGRKRIQVTCAGVTQLCFLLVVLSGIAHVFEDIRFKHFIKHRHVHGGDETQAGGPHHQDITRNVFTVTGQPAAHPAQRAGTKHQKPADETEETSWQIPVYTKVTVQGPDSESLVFSILLSIWDIDVGAAGIKLAHLWLLDNSFRQINTKQAFQETD